MSVFSVSIECWHQVLALSVGGNSTEFKKMVLGLEIRCLWAEFTTVQVRVLVVVFLQAQIEGQVWVLTVPFTTGATLVETGFFSMFCASRSQPPAILGWKVSQFKKNQKHGWFFQTLGTHHNWSGISVFPFFYHLFVVEEGASPADLHTLYCHC